MKRRNAFKALGAMLLAPLGFLKGAGAAQGLVAADAPEPGDRDISDTVGPYDRLGDTVPAKPEVWLVYDRNLTPPTDRPGIFTLGHPDCGHCHGKGAVLDGIGEGGWAEHKSCPACHHDLKAVGAICWYVVTPTPMDYCKAIMRASLVGRAP